jgi:hypothetical protein
VHRRLGRSSLRRSEVGIGAVRGQGSLQRSMCGSKLILQRSGVLGGVVGACNSSLLLSL